MSEEDVGHEEMEFCLNKTAEMKSRLKVRGIVEVCDYVPKGNDLMLGRVSDLYIRKRHILESENIDRLLQSIERDFTKISFCVYPSGPKKYTLWGYGVSRGGK